MSNNTPSWQNPVEKLWRLQRQIENHDLSPDRKINLLKQLDDLRHSPYFDPETGDVISIEDFQQRS